MTLQEFTEKEQELLANTNQQIHVVILASDGKDISTLNYGTDNMRVKMIAQFLNEESDEFTDQVSDLLKDR